MALQRTPLPCMVDDLVVTTTAPLTCGRTTLKESSSEERHHRHSRPENTRKRGPEQAELEGRNNFPKITTGKYNMDALRKISRAEETAVKELIRMYHVDSEDNLPVIFDVHQLVDLNESERRPFLIKLLEACPSEEVPSFVNQCLDRIRGLDRYK